MEDLEYEYLLKVVQAIFLKQTVTELTRGNNALDLVLVNNKNIINELDVLVDGEDRR